MLKKILQALHDKRAASAAIFATAKADGDRDLLPEEAVQHDALMAEIADLEVSETRAKAQAEQERKQAEAQFAGQEAGNLPAEGDQIRLHDKQRFANIAENLMAVVKSTVGHEKDSRLMELEQQAAATGHSGAVPQDGGFLVAPEFTTELLDATVSSSQIASMCRTMDIEGDSIEYPRFDETSRATGSRFGGVRVFRGNEADTMTASQMKFRKDRQNVEDLTGLTFVTDNLLEDQTALQSWITPAFSSEFNWVMDDEVMNGDGAGRMKGFLQSNALVSVAKETGQEDDTIIYDNVSNMFARMVPGLIGDSRWYMTQDAWPQLFKFSIPVGTGGGPVFVPPGGASATPFGTLFGRPIEVVEQAKKLGDLGDICFAALSQYLIVRKRGGIQAASSIHVKFESNQTAFRWKMRNNGQPLWDEAKTQANGSANKISPFIGLADR